MNLFFFLLFRQLCLAVSVHPVTVSANSPADRPVNKVHRVARVNVVSAVYPEMQERVVSLAKMGKPVKKDQRYITLLISSVRVIRIRDFTMYLG